MMHEESEASLKQMSSDFFEILASAQSALQGLGSWMREISSVLTEVENYASSSLRLEGIETRLSTLEAGLEKLIESHSIMLQQEELRNQTQFS